MTEDEFKRFMVHQELYNCFDEHNIDHDVPIEIDDSTVFFKRDVTSMDEYTGWKLCAMGVKRNSIVKTNDLEYMILINSFARPRIENCCDNLGFEYAWNEVFQENEQCNVFDIGIHKYYFNNVSMDSVKSLLKKQLHSFEKEKYRDSNHISIGASSKSCVTNIIKELAPLGFYSFDVTSAKYFTKKEVDELVDKTMKNVEEHKKIAPNKR